jgi:hypothetical protein
MSIKPTNVHTINTGAMMKSVLTFCNAVSIALFGILNCTPIQPEPKAGVVPIAFSRGGANFAWGASVNFTYYDTSGATYSYTYDASTWNTVSTLLDANPITMDQIAQLQTLCIKDTGSPPRSGISRMRQVALQIDTGNHAEKFNCGADMGGTDYCAYVYDRTNNRCSKILLFERGDNWRINLSLAADTICQWLVGATYNKVPCNPQ